MPASKITFTDQRLRNLKIAPEKKRGYFFDCKSNGLRLQVTSSGTKTFQFQVWDPARKKPVTRTLGKYPALSISKARELAAQEMLAVLEGIDIESEAQRLKHEDNLDNIFTVWLDQFAKPHKKSWEEDVRRYYLFIKDPLGKKKLSWFSSSNIRTWHRNITTLPKKRGTGLISPATANRCLALLSTIFNQMLPEHPNPCRSVKKFHEASRDRFLQPDELRRFFDALEQLDTPAILRDYILLSLFTGARRSNLLSMRWNEISFERALWVIPASKSKNAESMSVPLVDEALEILKQRKKAATSVFVFPGTGKSGHYSEPKKAWQTLLAKAGIKNVRLHDLRRTMGSWQTMTGASSTIVGKTLGHKSPEATAVYARMNLDPVKASMEAAVKAMLAAREIPNSIITLKQ